MKLIYVFLVFLIFSCTDKSNQEINSIEVQYIPVEISFIPNGEESVKSTRKFVIDDPLKLKEIGTAIRDLSKTDTQFYPEGIYLLAYLNLKDGSKIKLTYNTQQIKIGKNIFKEDIKLVNLLRKVHDEEFKKYPFGLDPDLSGM